MVWPTLGPKTAQEQNRTRYRDNHINLLKSPQSRVQRRAP